MSSSIYFLNYPTASGASHWVWERFYRASNQPYNLRATPDDSMDGTPMFEFLDNDEAQICETILHEHGLNQADNFRAYIKFFDWTRIQVDGTLDYDELQALAEMARVLKLYYEAQEQHV